MYEECVAILLRPFVWLSRIGRSKGFGVQSPTDYHFVRSVISERWPYYAYQTLGKGDGRLHRKLGRLYLRLSNWRQPEVIVSDSYRDYLSAGCRKARIVRLDEAEHVDLMVTALKADSPSLPPSLYNKVNNRSVLVVENIRRHPRLWQQIVSDERTGVSFDLYDCGIVMFDKKRYKQHYKINF